MNKKIYEETCAFYLSDGKCNELRGDKVTCQDCAFYKTKVQYAADVAKTAVRLKVLESVR